MRLEKCTSASAERKFEVNEAIFSVSLEARFVKLGCYQPLVSASPRTPVSVYYEGSWKSLEGVRSRAMDRWDILMLCVAGYVAITALVRLMTSRRNQLVNQVREQMADLQKKKKKTKKKEAA